MTDAMRGQKRGGDGSDVRTEATRRDSEECQLRFFFVHFDDFFGLVIVSTRRPALDPVDVRPRADENADPVSVLLRGTATGRATATANGSTTVTAAEASATATRAARLRARVRLRGRAVAALLLRLDDDAELREGQ